MVYIRLLTKADIDYVAESVQREGWGHTRRDVERCWQFEPRGCFIAESQGKPVGHVFTVVYGTTGWIGLLIVNPENRQKGIGEALMQTAIGYLQKTGAETILLEAAEKAVPLYRRLGFEEEFDSIRFIKQLIEKEKPKHGKQDKISLLQANDIEELSEFDSQYFGVNRQRVLKSFFEDQPQQCFIAKEKQEISGYIMSRKTLNTCWIGPWVCKNSETAAELLQTCIDAIAAASRETELRLSIPVLNTGGIKLLEEQNFQMRSKSIRMVWGKHGHEGDITGVYGIGGPEKG